MDIESARSFVITSVIQPAQGSHNLSEKTRNVIENTNRWLQRFKRVGDLWDYLSRFEVPQGDPVYVDLTQAGLSTFESIWPDFDAKFGRWKEERTQLSDFIVGASYTSFDLSIFTKTYDNRSGGILVIGKVPQHSAVFLKITMAGGKYPNSWLEPGRRLKTYLKSRTNPKTHQVTFEPSHVENRAVLEFQMVPIYAFVRANEDADFVLEGIFRLQKMHEEAGGSKWFELVKADQVPLEILFKQTHLTAQLDQDLSEAAERTDPELDERLAAAPKKPQQVQVVSTAFIRNPDVIAKVLRRANGVCEACHRHAPFRRRSDGSPYLEVHHQKRLADGGDDSVENAVAICPNCHRLAHFG